MRMAGSPGYRGARTTRRSPADATFRPRSSAVSSASWNHENVAMKVLVLGGTRFVGRAIVEHCLAAGYDVSLFNRGLTNPRLFPGIEQLTGDRTKDVGALAGRSWDIVFDVAAYDPAAVERSCSALAGTAGRYVFVSTVSVYADQSRPHGEDWPLLRLTPDTPEDELYGARKAASETIVGEAFGNRSLIVRAGMIVGPHDSTDRLAYWPRRMARGGPVLAPGNPDDPLQFIDVRDLAGWMVDAAARSCSGIFNATGKPVAFGEFLRVCAEVTSSTAEVVWVPSDRLLAAGVDPWMGVPLWIAAEGWQGANRIEVSRAIAAGLTFRSLAEIVRAAWKWDSERRRAEGGVPAGLTEERERELMALA
jgi:2'-hydroxyisoflavone reductase